MKAKRFLYYYFFMHLFNYSKEKIHRIELQQQKLKLSNIKVRVPELRMSARVLAPEVPAKSKTKNYLVAQKQYRIILHFQLLLSKIWPIF